MTVDCNRSPEVSDTLQVTEFTSSYARDELWVDGNTPSHSDDYGHSRVY
jgi:hypothetical protein